MRFVGWLIACACASAKVHVDPGPTEKMDSSGSLQRELSVEETDKVESVLSKAGLHHLKPRFVREKVRKGSVYECNFSATGWL